MTPEAQLALVNNIVPIITALVSLIGAVAAVLGYRKSGQNNADIKATNVNLDINTAKTEEVGKAVNGRMSAFIEEMKVANDKALAEAVKAARLDAERIALSHITDLKAQIAQAKSDKDVFTALSSVESKLMNTVTEVHVVNGPSDPVPVKPTEKV